ncbi:serine/threonine-protein kinase [Sedimentitalea todarodis]|uniref:serine/threonine-protein kinase n=1 Tax=Sedimentitalea todarodis TaxID=1631240 RepID=UPI002930C4DB|nr:serine/threonine-protein kinase [Sedimentitalea todarodis]
MKPPEFENSQAYAGWELLGDSRLGETWLARDAVTGQKSVLKIRREDVANPGAARRRWAQAATLSSPYLQRLLQYNQQPDGRLVIVHAFVPGPSLRDRISEGELPIAQALLYVRDVFCGLTVLHRNGMVHRDVSPENIILSDNGAVLIDFDAIGMLTEDSSFGKTTVVGDFAGKLAYMSPEQLVAAPQSASADIWATGAVLFEALTGQRLQSAKSMVQLGQSLGKEPDLAAAPEAVQPFLASLLAPDPSGRPDAEQAIARIDDLLAQARSAESTGWTVPQSPMPAPPQDSHRPVAAPPPRAAAKSAGWGIGAAVVVFLVAIMVLVAWAFGTLDQSYWNVDPANPSIRPPPALANPWHLALLFGGAILAISSFFIARLLRASASRAEVALPYRALELINAPDAHDRLAETICLRIDAYRQAAGRAAEDMLTVTMVALAKEYAEADSADERFRALQMLNELHGKVANTLKPWWMQYENLIARGLSLTALVAGLVAAIEGVRGLF